MDRRRTLFFLVVLLVAAWTVDAGPKFGPPGNSRDKRDDEPAETPPEPPAEDPTTVAPAEDKPPAETGGEMSPAAETETQPLEPTPDNTATQDEGGLKQVDSTTDKEWIAKAVKKHNEYRALHGAAPLVINETLCRISQAYANLLAETHKVQHNPGLQGAKLGENLFYNAHSFPKPLLPEEAVIAWYEEIHDYNFKTGYPFDDTKEILHFTQLVWKGTTDVGISLAKAKRPDGKHANYVVANYSPRGNFDDFLTNVLEKGEGGGKEPEKPTEPEKPVEGEKPTTSGSSSMRILGWGAILVLVIAAIAGFVLLDTISL